MLQPLVIACLLTVLLPTTGLLGAAIGTMNSSRDTYQEDVFQKQMDDAIARAEQAVRNSQANATTHTNAPTWNTKLEYQNAIVQLEVKKTLVNNFKGTESLKSPLVREKLLQVLNKPMVTTADLADLQSLVLEEKTKMKAQTAPSATITTPSTQK